MTRFFISYNKADQVWAEWIAWQLEEEGHSSVIQAWDFRPGGNFVLEMQGATKNTDKTIAVLSDAYLSAEFTYPEWAVAFVSDPQGLERRLIPIRVSPCKPDGILKPIIYVDLVDLDESAAREQLLSALPERMKPTAAPAFPKGSHQIKKKPIFLSTKEPQILQLNERRKPDTPAQSGATIVTLHQTARLILDVIPKETVSSQVMEIQILLCL